jgi:hypothetical protein
MTLFFAMVGAEGDKHPAFYLSRKQAPEGAVEVTPARHRELLDAQAEGREIAADARGRPVLGRLTRPSEAGVRTLHRAAIRREAAARIRGVSPEWQQLNDLRKPTDAGAVRFARIDAIREASNAIEELADSTAMADLEAFPIATHTFWPEFD